MLEIIRCAIAFLFGLFGVFVIVMNYVMIADWIIRRRHHSLSPLAGGICVSIGLLVCPVALCRHWVWVPLVVDPGCAYSLLALIYILIVRRPFSKQNTIKDEVE